MNSSLSQSASSLWRQWRQHGRDVKAVHEEIQALSKAGFREKPIKAAWFSPSDAPAIDFEPSVARGKARGGYAPSIICLTAAASFPLSGVMCCSMGGLKGTGTSGAHRRTGAVLRDL